jgi:trans-aconitate methyltransferase
MGLIGRQFGDPRGLVGGLIGRGMARGNARFNRWVVATLANASAAELSRVVELGCGPGVGLQELVRAFPAAQVWGVDSSPVMIKQARRRNLGAVEGGRLQLIEGASGVLTELAPFDLLLAVHVLYFWHEPAAELPVIRAALGPGGSIALGYRLRSDMPSVAQKQFPREGHRLYDSDDQVAALLNSAGFHDVEHTIEPSGQGRPGRLTTART